MNSFNFVRLALKKTDIFLLQKGSVSIGLLVAIRYVDDENFFKVIVMSRAHATVRFGHLAKTLIVCNA